MPVPKLVVNLFYTKLSYWCISIPGASKKKRKHHRHVSLRPFYWLKIQARENIFIFKMFALTDRCKKMALLECAGFIRILSTKRLSLLFTIKSNCDLLAFLFSHIMLKGLMS